VAIPERELTGEIPEKFSSLVGECRGWTFKADGYGVYALKGDAMTKAAQLCHRMGVPFEQKKLDPQMEVGCSRHTDPEEQGGVDDFMVSGGNLRRLLLRVWGALLQLDPVNTLQIANRTYSEDEMQRLLNLEQTKLEQPPRAACGIYINWLLSLIYQIKGLHGLHKFQSEESWARFVLDVIFDFLQTATFGILAVQVSEGQDGVDLLRLLANTCHDTPAIATILQRMEADPTLCLATRHRNSVQLLLKEFSLPGDAHEVRTRIERSCEKRSEIACPMGKHPHFLIDIRLRRIHG